MMNNNNQDEVKLVFQSANEEDIRENHLSSKQFAVSHSAFVKANDRVTNRAGNYMQRYGVTNDWFRYQNFDHATLRRLAHPIRMLDIEMFRAWTHNKDKYRDYEYNLLVDKYNNALTFEMKVSAGSMGLYNFMKHRLTPSIMCATIKRALIRVFDAYVPDALTQDEIVEQLAMPCRDQIDCSGALSCFSVAGADVNACWKADTQYDAYNCHFFRAALFHALAFYKYYTGKQSFYVEDNLKLTDTMIMETYLGHERGGIEYRKVVFDFAICKHPANRDEETDDEHEGEVKYDYDNVEDEYEDEEEGEEYLDPKSETTLEIILHEDGTETITNPEWIERITQRVEVERTMTKLAQIRRMIAALNILEQTAVQEQQAREESATLRFLEYQAGIDFANAVREEDRLEAEQRLAELRAAEPPAVAVVEEEESVSNFFFATSFSSDSDREEM